MHIRRVVAMLLVAIALEFASGLPARGQSDDEGPSLGDVARALRAKKTADLPVITNDNFSKLPQLIRETEQRALAAGLVATPVEIKHSEPEITCSLAFSAQAPSASAKPSSPRDLPPDLLAKLDGPAVISGDMLQVSIYNGSNWNVQEITVGITVVKRENQVAALAAAQLLPASDAGPAPMLKKPDETVLYHLKGSAPPQSTTAFKQALGLRLGPNDEWHWAILQARGVPPATP